MTEKQEGETTSQSFVDDKSGMLLMEKELVDKEELVDKDDAQNDENMLTDKSSSSQLDKEEELS